MRGHVSLMPLTSRIHYMSTTISMRRFAPSIGTYIQNLRLSSTGRHFHNGSNHITSEEAGTISNSPLNIVPEVKDKEVGDPNTRKPILGLGMVILPDELVSSIDTVLKSADKHHLRTDAMRIFESLRSTAGVKGNVVKSKSGKSVIDTGAQQIPYTAEKTRQKQRNVPIVPHQLSYGNREVLAYLSCRMPATYASIYRVFAELRLLAPDFNPSSVLDFGTGPGTTLWALDRTFSKPIESVVAVDSNAEMVLAAERLIQRRTEIRNDPDIESPPDVVKSLEFKRYLPVKGNFDMVVSAFTLSELQNDSIRNSTIDNLWNMTNDVLVLIDRGTPSGYHHILHARERILKKSKSENDTSSANVLAPCLHSSACPMANSSQDWCHFAQRMQRPRVMMKTKHCKNNFEDVKFSYIIIQKGKEKSDLNVHNRKNASRLVTQSLKRGGHVIMDGCSSNGQLERIVVAKSMGNDIFKMARKSRWGDIWTEGGNVVPGRGLGRVLDEDNNEKASGKD